MTVIMLLDDMAGGSNAPIEAAVDVSRLFDAEICCLDDIASLCGTPVARALRGEARASGPSDRCEICFERSAGTCAPLLRQATFIVTSARDKLIRLVRQGYGPVLLIPDGQARFRLAGRAVIGVDGSPSIFDNVETVAPLLAAATAIDVVTLGRATAAEGGRMLSLLRSHAIPHGTQVELTQSMLDDIDLGRRCRRVQTDWCLIGATGQNGRCPSPALTSLLDSPPCPLLVVA